MAHFGNIARSSRWAKPNEKPSEPNGQPLRNTSRKWRVSQSPSLLRSRLRHKAQGQAIIRLLRGRCNCGSSRRMRSCIRYGQCQVDVAMHGLQSTLTFHCMLVRAVGGAESVGVVAQRGSQIPGFSTWATEGMSPHLCKQGRKHQLT